MIDVAVPKLNTNDISYVLTDWLVEEGRWVDPGDPIAVIETSKAAEELASEQAGVLHRALPESAECRDGDVIGYLFESEEERLRFVTGSADRATPTAAAEAGAPDADRGNGGAPDADPGNGGAPILTEPARALAERHQITPAELATIGRAMIKAADVQRLIDKRAGATPATPSDVDIHEPGQVQRAVAATVTESHRSIPAAFTGVTVQVDAALRYAAHLSAGGSLVGLPELLVAAVSKRYRDFPLCYGRSLPDGTLALPRGAHVGVTVDVGKGLRVPVVHNAHERSVAEIADLLMDFRIRAMRETFRPADLAGGNIVVALNNDDDVLLATPIIMPGQICALSLAGTRQEVVPAPAGTFAVRSVVHLGLAYDHRFVNGRDAIRYLRAVKADLEALGSGHDATPRVPA